VTSPALAQDQPWSNVGGNAQRNGQVAVAGPDAADASTLLWQGAPSSVISWHPVIEGRRVYVVRQTGFPPEPASNASPIVALDLDTGAELWRFNIPFETGDWTTWIAGVSNGRVYAARSGNGASVLARLYCLDAATGAVLWISTEEIDAGPYDGVVFASDGDPIIGSFRFIWRFESTSGARVWRTARTCSVSSSCGCAVRGDAVYAADVVPGGQVIKRFNISTGAFEYQSPLMSGFLTQTTPHVDNAGNVYLPRIQNNAAVDFLYSFADSGSGLTQNWRVPAFGGNAFGALGVGTDGSIYNLAPTGVNNTARLQRLDPESGAVLNESAPIVADFFQTHMAVDQRGVLYVSNGAFSNGVVSSYNPDLTLRWSIPVSNLNQGAPALGTDGTLVIASTGTNVRAYRTERVLCDYDYNQDENVDLTDAQQMAQVASGVISPQPGWLDGDLNGDENADLTDAQILAAFVASGVCGA
jgi:outer membrane protein assembly factor BamB